ncbi:MAG: hypothetical protein JO307_02210 [Bryobacterales bacterium]|nr:hypothetical protein [Bryobacterales bacterium]MBV9398698.1 hypothetical protein [Bryobacterales bacterium]
MPEPWILPSRTIAVRLFLTCWLIFAVHLATNTVREIYLALAIGDHLSFRVDDYANMHSDLFEKKGYGWHIGANPGASMLGAIPYFLTRPVTDRIVRKVNQARAAGGLSEPPSYSSPWPMAREFYREAWKRGYDIKFGLASVVMQALCMAPISAVGVVAMFYLLRQVFGSDRTAFWLALLYGFGTPVFFRTGFLNHNMMMGHFTLLGFLAMWNPSGGNQRWSPAIRCFAGGLAGGMAMLLDYSGIVLLAGLFLYAIARYSETWFKAALVYTLGAAGPVLLLWFYQFESFGNPFFPGQHWMPPVEWIDVGYQGFTYPQPDLLRILLFDYRFGLFTTCPLMLLGLLGPWWNRRAKHPIPTRELLLISLVPVGLWLFCGGISYVRLQYNNGLRYLAPLLPYLFISVTLVLTKIPRRWAYLIAILAVAQAWSMAMYRDVERGFGVLDPIVHVFIGGLQLPALTVISRMKDQFGEYVGNGVSPLPVFALVAAIICAIWWRPSAAATRSSQTEQPDLMAVGRP